MNRLLITLAAATVLAACGGSSDGSADGATVPEAEAGSAAPLGDDLGPSSPSIDAVPDEGDVPAAVTPVGGGGPSPTTSPPEGDDGGTEAVGPGREVGPTEETSSPVGTDDAADSTEVAPPAGTGDDAEPIGEAAPPAGTGDGDESAEETAAPVQTGDGDESTEEAAETGDDDEPTEEAVAPAETGDDDEPIEEVAAPAGTDNDEPTEETAAPAEAGDDAEPADEAAPPAETGDGDGPTEEVAAPAGAREDGSVEEAAAPVETGDDDEPTDQVAAPAETGDDDEPTEEASAPVGTDGNEPTDQVAAPAGTGDDDEPAEGTAVPAGPDDDEPAEAVAPAVGDEDGDEDVPPTDVGDEAEPSGEPRPSVPMDDDADAGGVPAITVDNHVELLRNVFAVYSGKLYGDEVITAPDYSDPAFDGVPDTDDDGDPLSPPVDVVCDNGGTAAFVPETDGLPFDNALAWNFAFDDCQDGANVLHGRLKREQYEAVYVTSDGFVADFQTRTKRFSGAFYYTSVGSSSGNFSEAAGFYRFSKQEIVVDDMAFSLIGSTESLSISDATAALATGDDSGRMSGGFVVEADWTGGRPVTVLATEAFVLERDAGLQGVGMKFDRGRLQLDAGADNRLVLVAGNGDLDTVEITVTANGASETFVAPWAPWIDSFDYRSQLIPFEVDDFPGGG